jgi:hypothetical protein
MLITACPTSWHLLMAVFVEQESTDLRLKLEEREQDLAAARATNRELMTRLNAPQHAR